MSIHCLMQRMAYAQSDFDYWTGEAARALLVCRQIIQQMEWMYED